MSVSTAIASITPPLGPLRRTDSAYQSGWVRSPGCGATSNSVSYTSPSVSACRVCSAMRRACASRPNSSSVLLPAPRAAAQAEHRLEAPVAAHQQVAAQVGDADRRALQDRRHLAQQLSALRCCAWCCSVTSIVTTEVVRLPEASVAGSTRVSNQRWPSSGWRTA